MIYTVTLNPSLDYIVDVENLTVGAINRSTKEAIYPGGKGINVSIILSRLGAETTVIGFKAGFTGENLEHLVQKEGIKAQLLSVEKGFTRINVKVRGKEGTAINGAGPEVAEKELADLTTRLEGLGKDDTLVLSGSAPKKAADTLYADLAARMEARGTRCVIDATGMLLTKALPYHPFLVKPNLEELEEIVGKKLDGLSAIEIAAQQMQQLGARNVLVSLGGEGALLIDEKGHAHHHRAPKGKVLNTVGAGDSMVAGFLAGYEKTGDYAKALHWGICAGSATAFTMHLASQAAMKELIEKGE